MAQPKGEERRVVPFAAPAGRVRRRFLDDPGGRGSVLLFTGVRYERSAADGTASPAYRGSTPPSDHRRGT